MSDNIKHITFQDAMDLARDERVNMSVRGKGPGLVGDVTMIDKLTGRVCFRKRTNLIVLRGRTFALEKLFDDTIDTNGANGYVQADLDRKIIAFGVGKGGAPEADPFSPYAVVPTGQALAQQIPFRSHDTAEETSGNPLLYIPESEIGNYGDGRLISGTEFEYYLKHFESRDPVWVFDETANTVYKQITLSVTHDDCRTATTNMINELALFIGSIGAEDANGGVTFVNAEMFSRITFPTEYISGNKALEIVYNVYA
jgi:hypothetical protein